MTTPEVSAIRDADRIIGLLQANEMPRIELIINRLRTDMVKRGEMMSVEDVTEILAVDLLGAVPDDEAVVIATNQGEPLCGKDSLSGKALENICRRKMCIRDRRCIWQFLLICQKLNREPIIPLEIPTGKTKFIW